MKLSGDLDKAVGEVKNLKILRSFNDIWSEYQKVIEKAALVDDQPPLS